MAQRPDHRVEQPVGLTGDPFSGEGELMVDPLGGEDCLIAHPAFDACASPVRGDQAHRHTYESLGQRPAEEITAGAELTRVPHGRQKPFSSAGVRRFVSRNPGNLEKPDQGGLGRDIHQVLGIIFDRLHHETAERHLHVGLPTAKPNLTEHDPPDGDRLAVGDGHGVRAAGVSGRYPDTPIPVRISFGTIPFLAP